MFNKNKKGFTLIELLVVIAIIGILASVVLASLNSARRKSRDARRISDIKQLQLALELYFDAQSSPTYPGTLANMAGNQIPTIPKDPLSADYTYERCSATLYHLGAALEESTNPALNSDADSATGCTGTWQVDTAVCSGTEGTNQGSNCYDVRP